MDLSLEWLDERDPDKPFLLMCQQKARTEHGLPIGSIYTTTTALFPSRPRFLTTGRAAATRWRATMSIQDHFIYQWDMKFQVRVPFANDFESRLDEPERKRMNLGKSSLGRLF